MYETFYGFDERPFSLLPDPRFFYLGEKHSIALAALEYALMCQAGFSVVTGEIGAGKTTLVRHLLNSMPENISVGLITNTHQSFGSLLQWILAAFDIASQDQDQAGQYKAWQKYIIEQYAQGRRTLLIVDEAQNMGASTLEELRVLSNINADQDQMLQVMLVGQPELRDILRQDNMRQFAQRVVIDYHLTSLDGGETFNYIQHRLRVAGAESREIFSEEAAARIAVHSGGVPRLVNLLCDSALVYGFAKGVSHIDEVIVDEVVADKMRGQIVPLQGKSASAQ